MRCVPVSLALVTALSANLFGQSDALLSGTWRLNVARSEIRSLPVPPDPFLSVEQADAALNIIGRPAAQAPGTTIIYPLNGKSLERQAGTSTVRTTTKWEGATLLVNMVVSGPQNYSIMERWRRSRGGATLTITRTIVRINGEDESTLVYENAALPATLTAESSIAPVPSPATPSAPAKARAAAPEPQARIFRPETGTLRPREPRREEAREEPAEFVINPGARILLRLTNAVNTKNARPGDGVYLETAAPVFVKERLVIPKGSLVMGTITESQRAGRVKGQSALNLAFERLTLPNGLTRDLRSRAGSVDAAGNVERSEGRIKGETNKGGDAKTVGTTTAAGAGIGAIAGGGVGAGVGAAIGAAVGLAGVFGTRGKDVLLPAGTTLEMVLDRELRFNEDELR